jgi:hypothetical protein
MLRLTLLLTLAMIAALFTLGDDRGQLRPGLAKAEAEGRLDEVWAAARAPDAPAPVATPAPAPVEVVAAPEPEPPPAAVAPVAEPIVASTEVVQVLEDPVFTLSAIGNELVPGEDGAPVTPDEQSADASAPEPVPEVAASGGTIWYVNASSVNVRAAPSTEAEVLGRLGSGEAALMVAAVDSEWARIVIQGDGMEGYVALRFLSPEAP